MKLWPFSRRDGAEDPTGEDKAARFLASLSANRFGQVERVVNLAREYRMEKIEAASPVSVGDKAQAMETLNLALEALRRADAPAQTIETLQKVRRDYAAHLRECSSKPAG